MIFIDNSMLSVFRRCKEEFRQKWLMNRQPIWIPIHQVFGRAMHKAIELLWLGREWIEALTVAEQLMTGNIHMSDKKRWEELLEALPDCIACYSDTVDVSVKLLAIEQQFDIQRPFGLDGVTLIGRIDRLSHNQVLVDSKTAAEIDSEDVFGKKVGWERSYKERMLLDSGIGIYDFACRQLGYDVKEIQLEVILKPYPRYGKKARIVYIDMPEVIAYRERHDMLLAVTLEEMRDWIQKYAPMSPWPMTDSACQGKFGWCDFASICRYGPSQKIMKQFETREEHLEIGERISQ